MTTRVKICGITNREDALTAVQLGADALGFVFSHSPRQITPEKADKIISQLPPFILCVGVFANENRDRVIEVMDSCSLDVIQLHGNESPRLCSELKEFNKKLIKGIRVQNSSSLENLKEYNVDGFLLDSFVEDSFGGTGKVFNWDLIDKKKIPKPFILSGGLCADNVIEAINLLHPYGVDASSRLEKEPGIKDPEKVRAFMEAVKKADNL